VSARRGAAGLLALLMLLAIAAPFVSPQDPSERFPDLPDAPPTPLRLFTAGGQWCGLCFHPQRLVSRLERRFEIDTTAPVPVHLFSRGRLIADSGDPGTPLLLAGTDASGRDVFARLIFGARASLGVAIIAVLGAVALGLTIGGLAGARGGWVDTWLMRLADAIAVLPAIYVVVTLRAALPLVLPVATVFALITAAARRRRRAMDCTGSPRDRLRRAHAGPRRSGPRPRRLVDSNPAAAPAAGDERIHHATGGAAAARIRARRGHALVRRPGPSRHRAELGYLTPGSRQRQRDRGVPVAACAGGAVFLVTLLVNVALGEHDADRVL
jgi:hypothetical protein